MQRNQIVSPLSNGGLNGTKVKIIDRRPVVDVGIKQWMQQLGITNFESDPLLDHVPKFAAGEIYLVGIEDMCSGENDSTRFFRDLPHHQAIVLTNADELLKHGARLSHELGGLISPRISIKRFHDALITVCRGETFVDSGLAAVWRKITSGPSGQLTARQLDVLRLINDGLFNKEIAKQLNIRLSTVENHRAEIKRRLDVTTTAELISVAHRLGLL